MNEEELQQMVARARDAEGGPSQPPPELVGEARAAARRRRRAVTLGAGALVASVIVAVFVTAGALPQNTDDRVVPLPAVKNELAEHGGPCPSTLPTPMDDDGYGFGTKTRADADPGFTTPDASWVCGYLRGNGGAWRLMETPRQLDDALLTQAADALDAIEPGPGPQACTDDLGPRWMLVTSAGGDLTGAVVDDFGCHNVRLTDDPFTTAPGDPQGGGTVAGVLEGPDGFDRLLENWWDNSPADGDAPTPEELHVTCTDAGPQVETTTVAAQPAGVVVVADSTMTTPGSYLTYESDGLSGGDNLDEMATPTTYAFPPGTLTLGCASPPGMDVFQHITIEVTDPNGYWRTSTLADVGCYGGVTPSWKDGPGTGTGATAQAAVDGVLASFNAGKPHDTFTAEPAPTGYSGDPTQTWLAARRGRPYMSIRVTDTGTGFSAMPDVLCGLLE